MIALPRRFLFLVRHPPLAGARARETLDLIYTVAAFDQPVTVLFLDDGVLQLVGPRSGHPSNGVVGVSMLKAMDCYDIRAILADEESLQVRGLMPLDLAIDAELIAPARIRTLLGQHDRLVVC